MKYPSINTRETPSLLPGFKDSWPHVLALVVTCFALWLREPKDPPKHDTSQEADAQTLGGADPQ